jgi:hypothetical protein
MHHPGRWRLPFPVFFLPKLDSVAVPHRPLSQIASLRTHPQARDNHWIFVGPFCVGGPSVRVISDAFCPTCDRVAVEK